MGAVRKNVNLKHVLFSVTDHGGSHCDIELLNDWNTPEME